MKNNQQIVCPVCTKGHLHSKISDYTTVLPDGEKITVPNVVLDICDTCGEAAISLEASEQVEAFIAEQIEQLSTNEITKIRSSLNVDQTEMSETLGLGGKTYHRWEKGNQIPSRSMGYYLRILHEFPEAFAWLRSRGWRTPKVIHVDFQTAFPAIRDQADIFTKGNQSKNPAKALFVRVGL
jgi:putative zinc finger/helix-turn-helix YgiT family protein